MRWSISWGLTLRQGSRGPFTKQFAFMRVHRTTNRRGTGPIGWLIFERPLPGHEGDRKWYFSNYPEDTSCERLVELAHRRHEIERYYEDAKDELGLDHYEGRLWHGLHRHLVLVMWAYSWLATRRKPTIHSEAPKVSSDEQPEEEGSPPSCQPKSLLCGIMAMRVILPSSSSLTIKFLLDTCPFLC